MFRRPHSIKNVTADMAKLTAATFSKNLFQCASRAYKSPAKTTKDKVVISKKKET